MLHAGGPARILAPAGSGKTTVLAARFRHLVVERGYGASSVCALAYNRRAGADMQDRLGDLPRDAQRKVRTLNSFGYDIVRRGPAERARDRRARDPRTASSRTSRCKFRANTDALRPYLEALEEVALGSANARTSSSSNAATSRASPRCTGSIATASRATTRSTSTARSPARSRRCSREPELRHAVQRECRHLLVDEFQDLRPAHLLLVRLVAAPAYDVFGVGDDDQVIYGYSGADPGFLIDFTEYFPGAGDHPLEVNYRCPPPVVDGARMLLSHNRAPGRQGDARRAAATRPRERRRSRSNDRPPRRSRRARPT